MSKLPTVIPAKAGTHLLPPAAQGRWTPAFAGVTRGRLS
jgi:hypothetical protein